MTADDARSAAERAARVSYGRLLAILSARTRDIATAEDGLAEALASALRVWPEKGVPDSPEAWLLASARNVLLNLYRHERVAELAQAEIERRYVTAPHPQEPLDDPTLKLMFVCAHPAIERSARTPLMLQVVLGLDASRIASAFLVAPATMAQRLVRAKARIKDAGLRFEIPERDQLAERLGDVLDAIYAAFGTGWDGVPGAEDGQNDFAGEAIDLGRMVVGLFPAEPEPKGLLALMLFCQSRRAARRDADGRFVPLSRQDPSRWSASQIVEAETLLTQASRAGIYGRYQCEAAIQSVHAQRTITGQVNHQALLMLYGLLAAQSPTVGALVARASALREAGDAAAALQALDAIDGKARLDYQPFYVTRAYCLRDLGQREEASRMLVVATGLTEDVAVKQFLDATKASWAVPGP